MFFQQTEKLLEDQHECCLARIIRAGEDKSYERLRVCQHFSDVNECSLVTFVNDNLCASFTANCIKAAGENFFNRLRLQQEAKTAFRSLRQFSRCLQNLCVGRRLFGRPLFLVVHFVLI